MSELRKRSLEEAISLAKVSIVNDSETLLTIERARIASRKDFQISDVTSSRGPLSSVENEYGESQDSQVAFWRKKAESASRELKTTRDQIKTILQRNESLESYMTLLEQKIALSGNGASSNGESDAIKVAFYEMMTNMVVKPKEADTYVCTLKNSMSRIGAKFEIRVSMEAAGKETNPEVMDMRCRPVANAHLLPEYMRAEIDCSHCMAPVMLGDALQVLYDDEKEEEKSENGGEEK